MLTIEDVRAIPRFQLRSEVVAAHGDTHLTAIDIRNAASATVQRSDCGGLFIFIDYTKADSQP